MTIVTVRAPDSQKAMDEVIRRLGDDAYILSTTQSGGMVEIRASREAQLAATMPRFASVLAGIAAQPAIPQPAIPQPSSPQPAALQAAIPFSTARAASQFDLADLGRRLFRPAPLTDTPPSRLILVGPPGSGKSMLAARLAAKILRAGDGRVPRLIVPVAGPRLTQDRLRGWARMMNLLPEQPQVATAMVLPDPNPWLPEIIDLSEVPDHAADLAASLGAVYGAEVILCLPSGLHPARAARFCGLWHPFGATLCLTGLDLWEPEPDELAAIAEVGPMLARVADGAGLLDCLRAPALADLTHWAAGWDAARDAGTNDIPEGGPA
jgi:hypothetical protein